MDLEVLDWAIVGGMRRKERKGVRSEKQSVLLCSAVSDKETINGVALAKGIKSTHARLLFKLIKAPSPF